MLDACRKLFHSHFVTVFENLLQVSNIDIIHVDWCTFKNSSCNLSVNKAVFNHPGNITKSMDISDVVMEDIRVEGTCPRVVYLRVRSHVVRCHVDNKVSLTGSYLVINTLKKIKINDVVYTNDFTMSYILMTSINS